AEAVAFQSRPAPARVAAAARAAVLRAGLLRQPVAAPRMAAVPPLVPVAEPRGLALQPPVRAAARAVPRTPSRSPPRPAEWAAAVRSRSALPRQARRRAA